MSVGKYLGYLGKLNKLKIRSFLDQERKTPKLIDRVKDFFTQKHTFEVMFNPESYSFTYKNEYQRAQGINTAGRTARYSLTKTRELSLKIILDDTSFSSGLLSGVSSSLVTTKIIPFKDIHDRVELFLDLTARMEGDIHEPPYLRLEWGDLFFDCRLESVTVNYTLFNRSGKAIRAELDTVFIEDLNPDKLNALYRKSSPDLTHQRTVRAGDKLTLMTDEIYGSPSYYLRVAQANKLNNFRQLRSGKTLSFPPIK